MYLSNFKSSFLRKRDILICNVSMMNTYATDCLYDQNISLKRQKKLKYIWNRYISNSNIICYHWLSKSQNLCKHVHKIIIKKNKHNIEYFNLFISKCMNEKKITTRIKTGNNVRWWGRMKSYIVPIIMKAEDKWVLKSLSSLPYLSSNYVTFTMNS